MARSGILRSWDDQRGFGFIAPSDGGRELFVHISAFQSSRGRPTVGETLNFELGRGQNGKPQAVRVQRPAMAPSTRGPAHRPAHRSQPTARSRGPWRRLVLLLLIGACVWAWSKRDALPIPRDLAWPQQLQATLDSLKQKLPSSVPDNSPSGAPAAQYRCDGRTHCSQMRSCAEAKFFLANCPAVRMDGNNDGVPCQQQWCTSPWAD